MKHINQKRTITYYTSKTAEKWSEESLNRGIGGSQTAVIYLSRIWSKFGFDVNVYCNLDRGNYVTPEGVKYQHLANFQPRENSDVLLIWRNLEILDQNINAKTIYLDLHDVPIFDDYSEKRMEKVEKIFVKSEYHKKLLPESAQKKAVIIPNGADVGLFYSNNVTRDKNKIIYASDYYRGLELMLKHGWPMIKGVIPDVELSVFYGWDFFDAVWGDDPEKQEWKKYMINLMRKSGVKVYGRVGQRELAHHLGIANVLYYGCNFEEIDCITIRQAAIAGCIPCTTNYAVLADKEYSLKVSGNPVDKNTQMALANQVIDLLTSPKARVEMIRKDFQNKSIKESWECVAQQWIKYF